MVENNLISVLEKAVEQSPNDMQLKAHLGNVYNDFEYYIQALEIFQALLVDEPLNNEYLVGALKAAQQLGDEQLVKSFAALQESARQQMEEFGVQQKPKENPPENGPVKRVRGAKLQVVGEGFSTDDVVDIEDSNIYLKDVGGMDVVKHRLTMSFLAPLKNPDLMKAYGKSLGGGLMLYGPPGCGKTFIARALAGELGAKFISVGIADILDMYIGESERKLHEVFELARRSAPSVLFFDELDALAQKRSQLKHSGMRSLVNQFLSEMDSISSDNEGVFILAATNHPWDIDSALRRPGRFDRIVAVFPPDTDARRSILEYHLNDKPCEVIELFEIIKKTQGYSGADLKHLCDTATEKALEDSLKTGEVRNIVLEDLLIALSEVKPSTRSWLEHARNYAMFANEDGIYDDLLDYISKHI